ncbi:MAG: SoxR reducing system RseC family protein [Sphaerochaetaceae bacterium]|jgi:sigma-E factor negative regulatory protein RseC|nr:SoxR reducing system RseC family protein [Sphaerochaetaceae bacterium]HHU88388.1 SoxR reducing system RseC family protein [Spirochaetales bacterium]
MYEQASVVSIEENGMVKVTCGSSACNSCKSSTFCSTKDREFTAYNKTGSPLSAGDVVELYLPPGKTVFAGFIALLLPVLLFPLGYYLPTILKINVSEGIQILFGLGGIALGFLLGRLFSKVKGREYIPEITRIVEEESQVEE